MPVAARSIRFTVNSPGNKAFASFLFLIIFIAMKAAGIAAIKEELKNLSAKEISELCLRLARYKKDNKELLAYLLFDAQDTDAYTRLIKEDMDEVFKEVNRSNLHLAKKTLRKILRKINKYVSFTL